MDRATSSEHPLRVIFLDDDPDLREVMVEVLNGFGAQAQAVGSVAQLQDLIGRSKDFGLAILDVNLQPDQPTGIDAYSWLRDVGFPGRIAFLTGHAWTHPLVESAARVGDAAVYEKPLTADQLLGLLETAREAPS
jgi:DNA-binding NtrC family response regulator